MKSQDTDTVKADYECLDYFPRCKLSVLDMQKHQGDYRELGVTSAKMLCQPNLASSIARRLLDLADKEGLERDRLFEDPDTGGTTVHKDIIANTQKVLGCVPEIEELYETSRALIQDITDRDVVRSPFEDSRLTLKVYKGVGAEHGWHHDTNSVSGIFALTENLDDSPLVYCKRGTTEVAGSEYCEPGKPIILKGHDIWHRVEPVRKTDTVRATLIMNYYHPGEERRLKGFDETYYA